MGRLAPLGGVACGSDGCMPSILPGVRSLTAANLATKSQSIVPADMHGGSVRRKTLEPNRCRSQLLRFMCCSALGILENPRQRL
jgi:hypothetical protein